MCKAFTSELNMGHSNLNKLGTSIKTLKVPCKYKAAFMRMARYRGFVFTKDTLSQMQTIGETDSDVLISLLDRKTSGLIVSFILAIYLDTDKQRAEALTYLIEMGESTTEKNILRAILFIKSD